MKDHNEFMKEAADANSLPAQTQRALAPESQEDIAMYADENYTHPLNNKNQGYLENGGKQESPQAKKSGQIGGRDLIKDANCEENVGGSK